jgi:hypothetical protein
MNKEQLITENSLLRQQNEILSKQIEQLTPKPSTWRTLIGKVWNANADTQMTEWTRQARRLSTLLEQQNVPAQEGAPIEKWTPLHELRLNTYRNVLRQPDTIHAFCEFRERQRNAQLGEPPTISELGEILSTPEQKNPEVDKVSFSATPTITPQLDPITTDFLPHK